MEKQTFMHGGPSAHSAYTQLFNFAFCSWAKCNGYGIGNGNGNNCYLIGWWVVVRLRMRMRMHSSKFH